MHSPNRFDITEIEFNVATLALRTGGMKQLTVTSVALYVQSV